MKIVIDANVLCAALLAKGKTAELLFSDQIEPVAPELLFTELERHRKELVEKTKLSENDLLWGLKPPSIPRRVFQARA
jgi:predicted nucleic acid-binding protein